MCAQFQRMSELLYMPLIPDSKLEACVDRVYYQLSILLESVFERSDKSIPSKKLDSYQ